MLFHREETSRTSSPLIRRAKTIGVRVLGALVVIVGVTFLAFLLSYISPTDAATQYFSNRGVAPTEAELAAKRAELGLDRPFWEQYISWIGGLLQGDMGESYRSGRSVAMSLASALPYTLSLTTCAMILTLLIALPLGLYCAYRKDGAVDMVTRVLTYAFYSLPSFFLALLLLYILSVQLHFLPASSKGPVGLIMPTLSLAIPLSAWYVRQVRAIALEQLSAGYFDGLRSRGVSEKTILFKHVLRNSLVPILSLVGISIGSLLGGSAIVECIFSWPGVGDLSVDAINSRDYTVVQGYALLMAVVYLIVNWLIDVLYRVIDPRIRKGDQA